MKVKKRSINSIFNITCLLVLAALSLAACGSFAIQGQAQPNGDSGVTISGSGNSQIFPDQSSQSNSPAVGGNTMLLVLILVGSAVFILVLLMVIARSKGQTSA